MAFSLKHLFNSAKADGVDTTLVQPSNWNAEHTMLVDSRKLLGRSSAGNGAVEEVDFSEFGVKPNKIINGDMSIDQRNGGASVTLLASGYVLDRWSMGQSQASKVSSQQNAGAVALPAGASNYYGATSLSNYAVLTTDFFGINQPIEGYNVADLQWGTANAKAVTLSFMALSSLTGTFGGSIRNSAGDRSYPFSYSIPVANTWTAISITIPGDTAGVWLKTSGIGMSLYFSIGAGATLSGTPAVWAGANYVSATGAVSVVGTNNATFYLTNVKLEAGSIRTDFIPDDYTVSRNRCQRYCYVWQASGAYDVVGVGNNVGGVGCRFYLPYPRPLRADPVFSTSGNFGFGQDLNSGVINVSAAITKAGSGYGTNTSINGMMLNSASQALASCWGQAMAYNDATAKLIFDAEL